MNAEQKATFDTITKTIHEALGKFIGEYDNTEPTRILMAAVSSRVFEHLGSSGASTDWIKFIQNPRDRSSIAPGNLATALLLTGHLEKGIAPEEFPNIGNTYTAPDGTHWVYRDGECYITPVVPTSKIDVRFTLEKASYE